MCNLFILSFEVSILLCFFPFLFPSLFFVVVVVVVFLFVLMLPLPLLIAVVICLSFFLFNLFLLSFYRCINTILNTGESSSSNFLIHWVTLCHLTCIRPFMHSQQFHYYYYYYCWIFCFIFWFLTIFHQIFTQDLAWKKVVIIYMLRIYVFCSLFGVIFFSHIDNTLAVPQSAFFFFCISHWLRLPGILLMCLSALFLIIPSDPSITGTVVALRRHLYSISIFRSFYLLIIFFDWYSIIC